MIKFAQTIIVSALILMGSAVAEAQTIEDEALAWLKAYLQVDTVNPPGNESRAVAFYARILEAEGIPFETQESAPGRGNIWARLKGGAKPALMLLQHTDVVPADARFWSVDPFSGTEKDGYIYGRGAVDMKGGGIIQLAAFIALKRSGVPLNRDLIFMATADEEAGGLFGAGWLVKNRPELFRGVGIVLNEGGTGTIIGGRHVFNVEVTQKVPVWLRLKASGQPGHGSRPLPTSATTKIVRAMSRILDNPFEPRILPAMDSFFKALAQTVSGPEQEIFADMAKAVRDPAFMAEFQKSSPRLHALTRDTCSITRFGASPKINVVAPSAWAEIDCRMLPDRPASEFIADIKALLEGTGVEVETIMAFSPAVSSSDTDFFRAIEETMKARYPGSLVIPSVSTGFTDSHFMRDLGIDSYGFNPIHLSKDDGNRLHGNDERIGVADFRRAVADLRAIVEKVVTD